MHQIPERRHDFRLLCADLIEVIWEESGQEKRRVANLENISRCGMSLQLEVPIHVGTRIRILCGKNEFSGVVRNATYNNQAYFLGVQLALDSRWSGQVYLPQHLTDPRQVIERMSHAKGSESNSTVLH